MHAYISEFVLVLGLRQVRYPKRLVELRRCEPRKVVSLDTAFSTEGALYAGKRFARRLGHTGRGRKTRPAKAIGGLKALQSIAS